MIGMEMVQMGQRMQALVHKAVVSNKTSSPCARQHYNLGLFDSLGDEVFDDFTDDQGSHECILR